MYGWEWLERLAVAKTLYETSQGRPWISIQRTMQAVKHSMVLYRFEAGEGTKDQ